ncbi:hypothetical protein, partial [Roseiflexus sp.]
AQGDVAEQTFKPRGLLPEAEYVVRFIDGKHTLRRTGAELERDGVVVALEEFGSEIIMLDVEG